MSTKIDPRGPRFGAAITSTLLAITVFLALDSNSRSAAQLLLDVIAILFAVGALFGNAKHPYGWIFKTLVRPRLSEPKELEDAAPPRFAQLVGLLVAGTGAVLGHLGVGNAVLIAAALAFFAAFLNAAFNFCLGCQIYFGLKRLRVIR
jgi:uncharacterized membrane protein YjdF